MQCPFCSQDDDKVIDSRSSQGGQSIRRRRECIPCGQRFTTYEHIEFTPLMVIKKNGQREPFQRQKLVSGLLKACEKRPVSSDAIYHAVDQVELTIRKTYSEEIPSSVIGEHISKQLKDLDQVAYVRFASVYNDFKDVNEFMSELKGLLNKDALS